MDKVTRKREPVVVLHCKNLKEVISQRSLKNSKNQTNMHKIEWAVLSINLAESMADYMTLTWRLYLAKSET